MTDREIIARLKEMSDQDIGRYSSGGYGIDRQREFLIWFRRAIEIANKPK